MCLLGATDAQMAAALDVSESTLNLWKLKHPGFSESIRQGKDLADGKVAESLFKVACGYKRKVIKPFIHEGQTFEHTYFEEVPPDAGAALKLLMIRRGVTAVEGKALSWQGRPEVEVTQNVSVQMPPDVILRARELAKRKSESGGGAVSAQPVGGRA